jgi:hypothetical protein
LRKKVRRTVVPLELELVPRIACARSLELAAVSHSLPRAAQRLRRVPTILATLGEFTVALVSLWCKHSSNRAA